jgi:hypothetical protein
VEAKGFKTMQLAVDVQVNTTANGSIKLQIGQESTVVEVQASEVQVNTEQAEVQGVLTAMQISSLPVNGRNFLDLAQLEPGVQIQDGENFDPTKVGYSSISFGGRFGRTARINVDGVGVSDETVGTTTEDRQPGRPAHHVDRVRSEPVREPEEIFFTDCVQHLHHSTLNDLIFKRGDPQRALPPIRFWNVPPS